MPTTDLPQTTTVRGSAGFKWFPNGSTNRPEQVHALNYPPELIPGGGLESADRKFRAQSRSIDGSNLETWTVGGSTGTEEITLRVRFDGWPESLLDLVGDAHDGVTIDYYPRLESTNLSFPSELLGVEDVARIREDEDRFSHAEYQADLRLKDASSDSQGYWWLKSPNKLKNPRLARGVSSTLVEDWQTGGVLNNSTDVVYAVSPNFRCQDIWNQGSTNIGEALIKQSVDGVLPGENWTIDVDIKVDKNPSTGTAVGELQLEWESSTGVIRKDTSTALTSTSFNRVSFTSTAPSSAVRVNARMGVVSRASSGEARTRMRDAKLTLQ